MHSETDVRPGMYSAVSRRRPGHRRTWPSALKSQGGAGMLYLAMAVAAALAFTVGGVFMKHSHGFSQLLPSLVMLALFGVGAILLTLSIEARGELGPAYLVVIGLEAILAFAFGAMLFGEQPDVGRLIGLALLIIGMILIEGGAATALAQSDQRQPVVVSRS